MDKVILNFLIETIKERISTLSFIFINILMTVFFYFLLRYLDLNNELIYYLSPLLSILTFWFVNFLLMHIVFFLILYKVNEKNLIKIPSLINFNELSIDKNEAIIFLRYLSKLNVFNKNGNLYKTNRNKFKIIILLRQLM